LDYVKNVRLNYKAYYQELKKVDTIQAIFYIALYIISVCDIMLLATLNIYEFLSQKRRI